MGSAHSTVIFCLGVDKRDRMLIFVVQWTRIWNDYHFPCAGFTHRYISQRNSACYLLAYECLHWYFLNL